MEAAFSHISILVPEMLTTIKLVQLFYDKCLQLCTSH